MSEFGLPTSIPQYQAQKAGMAPGVYNPTDRNNAEGAAGLAAQYAQQQDPYGLNSILNSSQYASAGVGNNTQAYDTAYQNAVNASRANITQALGAAMTELTNRQGAINAAGAAAPGQIDASYGRANDAINANTGAVSGIMGQAAVNPAIGPSMAGANAPVLAALAGNQAEAQSGVQPVVSGLNAEISKERAQLQMDAGDKLSALGMQAADHQTAASSNEPSWMQKLMIQNQIDSVNAKNAADAKAQAAAAAAKPKIDQLNAKTQTISPSSGKAFINSPLSAGQATTIRSGGAGRASKAYAAASSSLGAAMRQAQSASDEASGTKIMRQAWQKLQHTFPRQSYPFSIALADLGMSDKQFRAISNG